jgi:hypothetical protein
MRPSGFFRPPAAKLPRNEFERAFSPAQSKQLMAAALMCHCDEDQQRCHRHLLKRVLSAEI